PTRGADVERRSRGRRGRRRGSGRPANHLFPRRHDGRAPTGPRSAGGPCPGRRDDRADGSVAVIYDWRRTIAYVDQNGNEMERARLRGVLGRPRPETRIIRLLEASQNEDGAFPSNLVQGRPSSIDTTALVLSWMQDLS